MRKILLTFFIFIFMFPLQAANSQINVVCTFTILEDMIKNIGKEHVKVISLVGPNSDPHVFTPSPQSAEILAKADLVFTNGHGFEGWMDRLIQASGYKGKIIQATEGMMFILAILNEKKTEKKTDPHTWLTIGQALVYIKNIRDALSAYKPDLKQEFEKNYQSYKIQLEKVEKEIRSLVLTVAESKRKVITAHDAFNYFGDEYGIKFFAPQGITTESEASAQDVAKLINEIKSQKIKAVFVENITNERLIRQIAYETGVEIKGTLYTDALSEKHGPASTYIDLMRHNVNVLVVAMQMNGFS